MYYAEYCPYGANTISDCDILHVFADKKSRDDFVEEDWEHNNEITRDYARYAYGSELADGSCRKR